MKQGQAPIPEAESIGRQTGFKMNQTIQARDVDSFHAEVQQNVKKERFSDTFTLERAEESPLPRVRESLQPEDSTFGEKTPVTYGHHKISGNAFEALWRKTAPVKFSLRSDEDIESHVVVKAASRSIAKIRAKPRDSLGDLTKQYSQVISEAHLLTENKGSKEAKRTVVGLPGSATIPLKRRSTVHSIQHANRVKEFKEQRLQRELIAIRDPNFV